MAAVWSRVERNRVSSAGVATRVVADHMLVASDLVLMPMHEGPEFVSAMEAG